MMIYYRSTNGHRDLSLTACRALSACSLVAYPAGALLLALGKDSLPELIGGYGLILLSLVFALPLFGSGQQRVVAEEVRQLDEYELRLRGQVMNQAYVGFTLLTLISVIYAAIASDKGGWVPSSYEEFNGLFWGVILYAAVLPVAILSWTLDAESEAGDE